MVTAQNNRAMTAPDYEHRRARLKQLLALCGGSQAALATQIDKQASYVSRLLSEPNKKGHKNIGDDIAAAARIAFSLPHGWFDMPLDQNVPNADERASSAPQARGVAQPVSLETVTVVSIVQWEQLMTDSDLPDVFKVKVPDQAMAPRFKKDQMVEFSRGVSPEPGDGVLVTDRAGTFYFREYRERRAGVWEAHAYNASFGPMDAESEGLTVFAVLTGFSGRLSQ